MCVSFGVMLPVGNPPNAIVFSYGHVQIKDMVRLTHARSLPAPAARTRHQIQASRPPGESGLRGEPHRGGRGHVGHHHVGSPALQPDRVPSLGRDPERYRDLITSAGDEGRESKDNKNKKKENIVRREAFLGQIYLNLHGPTIACCLEMLSSSPFRPQGGVSRGGFITGI